MNAVQDVAGGALPARQRPRRTDAYVLAGSDEFLLELGPIAAERVRTKPVDSPDDIPAGNAQPWLVLIDGVQANARALVTAVIKRFPNAQILLVVPDAQQSQWLGALAGGTVTAVLAQSQFDAASFSDAVALTERRQQPAAAGGGDTTTQALQALRKPVAAPGAPPPADARGRLQPRWLALAAAVAILLVAAVVWIWPRNPDGQAQPGNETAAAALRPAAGTSATPQPATSSPAAAANTAPPAAPRSVLELLSLARIAFRDQARWLPRSDSLREPLHRGDSALELYAEVVARDSGNGEARDGVQRLFGAVQTRLQADVAAGRLDEAAALLAMYRTAGAGPQQLARLDADFKSALPKWHAAQTQRAISSGDLEAAELGLAQLTGLGGDRRTAQDLRRAIDAAKADREMQRQGDELRAAIAAGNLLEPAAGNARARLQAMRSQNRSHAATQAAQQELQQALLERARAQLEARQPENALRWVAAASEIAASSEATELRRRVQAELDQQAAARAEAARPPPAPTPAEPRSAPPPPRPAYLAAHPVRPMTLTYPAGLAASGVVGSVVVEFTLQPDGSATDIAVAESTANGVFDKFAMAAVARARYSVADLGPEQQPRRARIKLNFKP